MTMLSEPTVSVIIPHYNDLAGLDLCLSALEAQTLRRDQFEIVVADNRSPCGLDAVRAVVRDRARLVEVAEKGAGPARNGAVAAARGAILAFTDSDCVPVPEWLEAGLCALAWNDIVGGQVTVASRDPRRMTPTEAFETVFAFNFRRYILREGFTGSGNLFVSRETFRHVGGFRKGLSEDKEWCHRARALGHAIAYEPRAIIAHPARHSWQEFKAKWLRIQSESFGLVKASATGRLRWLARTWLMPFSILPHAVRVLTDPKLPDLTTRLAAIEILVRQRIWRFFDGHALLLRWRE